MEKYKLVTLFLLITIVVFGQENLIYKKIQDIKETGKRFNEIIDVFDVSEKKQSELKYFKKPDEVFFLDYDSNKVLNIKEKNIIITIPLNGQNFILELAEVSDTFYEYIITTSRGKVLPSNKNTKYYRGIIKDDSKSIVALSFYKNNIIGLIANDDGNYNISKINNSNKYIIFNDKNLLKQEDFICNTKEDIQNFKGYDKSKLFIKDKTTIKSSSKCVKLYFETEYDMFSSLASIANVEDYVTGVYNQVALLFENENINTAISEIMIWNTQDPYNGTTEDFGQDHIMYQFKNERTSFNGDLAQLLTFRQAGGGYASSKYGLCNEDVEDSLSFAGSLNTYITPFPNYSWNVNIITHEFGHLLGSFHTHSCVWNSNQDTQIDDCGSAAGYVQECYDSENPILPNSGTVMSYCHLITSSVGVIDFNLGFGIQPGNVIRDNVASASCLSSCNGTDCEDILFLEQNVNLGQTDIQESSNIITAINTIFNGATAEYDAGITVFLKPGFHAKPSSNFRAYIEGCQNTKSVKKPINKDLVLEENKEIEEHIEFIKIYPNPTKNTLTIESNKEVLSWLITSAYGKSCFTGNTTKTIDMGNLPNGIYFLKGILKNGNIIMKKIIKK